MTRGTHDRQRDHDGPDLATNVVLEADAGDIPAGTTIEEAIATLGSSGGGSVTNMLDREDAAFFSSLGNWTASGGTLTRDTGVKLVGFNGSLKLDNSTGSAKYVEVPVDGTFRAATTYYAILIAKRVNTQNGSTIQFGDLGSSEGEDWDLPGGAAFTDWTAFAVKWLVDGDDHTGVKVRLTLANGDTLYIGWAAVFQSDVLPILNNDGQTYVPMTENASSFWYIGPFHHAGLYGTNFGSGVFLESTDATVGVDVYNNGFLLLFSDHGSGDLADDGVNIEAGSDFVGIYISERDINTVQIYPDASAGYDIELKNRGARNWKIVKADDTIKKNLLAMEERKGSGSATITSGNTSIAVTHGAGYTPVAADIRVLPTNNPTNDPGNFWISAIGATQFTINVRANPGASGAIFTWVVDR